jgi:hypothetical protein
MDTLYGTPFAPFGPRRSGSRSGAGGRGPVEGANMRVSDAERGEVADELSKHYSDGRLDEAEFNERLTKAMAAKTRGDLAGLLDDLPRSQLVQAAPPATHRHGATRILTIVLAAIILSSIASSLFMWHGFFHFPVPLFVIAVLILLRRRHRHLHRYHGGHDGADHGHYGPVV